MAQSSLLERAERNIRSSTAQRGKEKGPCKTSRIQRTLLYHLKTVWLFTFSDLKTIVGPSTVFAAMNAWATSVYEIQTEVPLKPYTILVAALWVWINLLPFVIDNQRRTESILEDKSNKPWRPLPSGRISQREARVLMMILYPIAFLISLGVRAQRQSVGLMVLGYWYNSLGGSSGVMSKNFINACGFLCFASGAMEVALGRALPLSSRLVSWLLMIWGVVFTTVQTQDLPDQAGDLLSKRITIPLALGDGNTRWITALFMGWWSVVCPMYWKAPPGLFGLFVGFGFLVAFRTLTNRVREADERTFQLWNWWMVILYSIPLVSQISRSGFGFPEET